MIKKQLLTLCLFLWMGLWSTLMAQNAVFGKYADMDHVKYVSIGRSMLENMAKSGKSTIGGVDIRGLGPDMPLNGILIISTAEPAVGEMISSDEKNLTSADYVNMIITQDGKKHRSAIYFHEAKPNNELVMFVTDGPEQTVIVLTGTFSQKEIERMFL